MGREAFDRAVAEVERLLASGALDASLEAIERHLSNNPRDWNFWSYAAGVWIDAGSAKSDLLLVDRGIDFIENVYKSTSVPRDAYPDLLYNLANGYGARYPLLLKMGRDNEASEALQREKRLLQEVLLDRDALSPNLLPLAMTNYANALDHLGRTVEAVDGYYDCLQIAPDHAVAMGNCGNALQNLFNVDPRHNPAILYESWRLLAAAAERPHRIRELAGYYAVDHYRRSLAKAEELAAKVIPGGVPGLVKWADERQSACPGWAPGPELERIFADRLFLTVNPSPWKCPDDLRDDVFFRKMSGPFSDVENKRLASLAHALNQIKEDFATARYLYYQSQREDEPVSRISLLTDYADVYDYAQFGLRSGFLKASFRVAADCMDKVAGLLNSYFELGHPADRVAFGNVWYAQLSRDRGLHPALERKLLIHRNLRALQDVSRDWFVQSYPAPLKDLRNAATHRRLVLHWMGPTNGAREDTEQGLESFGWVVLFVLRQVRAAVLYLVGVIQAEEQELSNSRGGRVAPMRFHVGPARADQHLHRGGQ